MIRATSSTPTMKINLYAPLSIFDVNEIQDLSMTSMSHINGGFWEGFPETVPSRRKRFDMIIRGDDKGIFGLELRSEYMSVFPKFHRTELAVRMAA